MKNGKDGVTPDLYQPLRPIDLIGDARPIATKLGKHLRERKGALKVILYGAPGVGKTSVVTMMCRLLAKHSIDTEKVNGRLVSIELVREWQRGSAYASLFGGWKVKHLEEIDLVAQVSQDVMLTYLDELPHSTAVIGTSNRSLDTLTERFQTRFQLIHLHGPTNEQLAQWLNVRWHVPRITADFIALGSGGNVREALLAAQGFTIFGKAELPERRVTYTDPRRAAAARRAWETMRGKGTKANG